MFSPWQIPALLIASTHAIGGLIPFINAPSAIRAYGLPPRIINSPEAQVVMQVYGIRASVSGVAIWLFYRKGMLEAVDTIFGLMGVTGLFDGWICWNAGVRGNAVFRACVGAGLVLWGVNGMTSW